MHCYKVLSLLSHCDCAECLVPVYETIHFISELSLNERRRKYSHLFIFTYYAKIMFGQSFIWLSCMALMLTRAKAHPVFEDQNRDSNSSIVQLEMFGLSIIPSQYFAKHKLTMTTMMSIAGYNVEELDAKAFDGLPHLNILHLRDFLDLKKPIAPETFSGIKTLEKLVVTDTNVGDLSLKFLNVREVVLTQNSIQNLPEKFLEGTEVNFVDLSENLLTSLKNSFSGLPGLGEIDLSRNNISRLEPDTFAQNLILYQITISNNRLKSTDGLRLLHLVHLNMSDNLLEELTSKTFEGMTGLKSLSLRNNKIAKIESLAFASLRELRHLELSFNEIDTLHPDTFLSNYQLETLRLEGNRLSVLQPFSNELNNLHFLNLSGNNISEIDKDFFRNVMRLNSLDMSGNTLKALDDNLRPLLVLVSLDVSDNLLSTFSGNPLKYNQNLKKLNLSRNYLQISINDFGNNMLLTSLDLGRNRIRDFCSDVNGVESFRNLRHIDLSYNFFRDGSCLSKRNFPVLEKAVLDGNKLEKMPELKIDQQNYTEVIDDDDALLIQRLGDTTRNGAAESLESSETEPTNIIDASQETEEVDSESDESDEEVAIKTDSAAETTSKQPEEVVPVLLTAQNGKESQDKTTVRFIPATDDGSQSERRSWERVDEEMAVNIIENEEEINIERHPQHSNWFSIALILIGVSVILVLFNVVGLMYLRSRTLRRMRQNDSCSRPSYVQLRGNQVYQTTTSPNLNFDNGPPSIFNSKKIHKLFVYDKLNEMFLNFGVLKKEDDSESVKQMIDESATKN